MVAGHETDVLYVVVQVGMNHRTGCIALSIAVRGVQRNPGYMTQKRASFCKLGVSLRTLSAGLNSYCEACIISPLDCWRAFFVFHRSGLLAQLVEQRTLNP